MVDRRSLLPLSSRTPWERAISEAVAAWHPLPVDILGTLYDPMTCSPGRLPSLAAELGMPLWLDRWTIEQKRAFTQEWISLARRRGRRPTFAAILRWVDAPLVDFITPPQILAPRRGRTPAERAAYRAQFPELRVYVYARPVQLTPRLVSGRPWFGARRVARASIAPDHAGRRAEVHDGGSVTPVGIRVEVPTSEFVQGHFSVRLPSRGLRLTAGRPWGGAMRTARASSAAARVYRYAEGEGRPDTIFPSLEPFDLRPDRVRAEHGAAPKLVPGRPWFGARRVARASEAIRFVYDSLRLYDPERVAVRAATQVGGWYLGRGRLGMDPFRIEAVVDTAYTTAGHRFGRFVSGVVRSHDNTRVREVCAALRAAKIGRDQVVMRPAVYRPIIAADEIPPDGSYLPGQLVRDF